MKRTIADKAEIFQQLIRLHEQELAIEKESIERLKNSDSFTAAVAKARARVLRIEQLLQEFRAQAPLFESPSKEVAVGALATVDSSQYGPRRQLIVHDTEVDYFDRDYELAAVRLRDFPFKKLGDRQSYFTGRPGEQFEVTETLIRLS